MQHAKIMNVLRQTYYIYNMNPDTFFLLTPNLNFKNNRYTIVLLQINKKIRLRYICRLHNYIECYKNLKIYTILKYSKNMKYNCIVTTLMNNYIFKLIHK